MTFFLSRRILSDSTRWHASFFWLSFCLVLVGCQNLPTQPHLPKSTALTQAVHTRYNTLQTELKRTDLAVAIDEQQLSHPTLSGYYPISTGANAFAARSILTDMASHNIDVQYYIWHDDEAGQLMLQDLWQAAERGVLVRILLDDINGSPSLDKRLLQIDQHPNVSVRLINPMAYRRFRFINYVTNPMRVNTRMHNKSMTFDNHISIIGGRNIGNEYLNNTKTNQFADLDVLLIGKVVPDITDSFNQYWDSPFAYDISTLVKSRHSHINANTKNFIALNTNTTSHTTPPSKALSTYQNAISTSTIGEDLLQKKLPFRWAEIDFVADPASKLQPNNQDHDRYLVKILQNNFGTPKQRLSIVSSYFVPTKEGVETLTTLAKNGVDVRILTNSYDATDVGAVHSGYAHWRKELLSAGIRLFELKSTVTNNPQDNKLRRTAHQTTTSLHAKAFAVDGYQVFIGSYNVDPRSANINTELGVVIYDAHLAEQLHHALNDNLLHQAYEVKLNHGQLEWHTLDNEKMVILTKEPNMQISDKVAIFLMSLLPIDGFL